MPLIWAVVGGTIVPCLWVFFAKAIGSERDPAIIDRFLAAPRTFEFYSALVERILGWIDRRLTPRNVTDDAFDRFRPMERDRDAAQAAGTNPFGWPVLDLTLRVALAYPLLLLFLNWSGLGVEGRVGTLVVLPPEPPWPASHSHSRSHSQAQAQAHSQSQSQSQSQAQAQSEAQSRQRPDEDAAWTPISRSWLSVSPLFSPRWAWLLYSTKC